MLIGYARVSTEGQNLDLQLQSLNKVHCERIFTDKKAGSRKDRPGLVEALSHLRARDSLIDWKLDRLGRTVKGLVELVTDMKSKQVNFKSLTQGIDTTSSAGRFFHVMASLAQMEKELAIERTEAGLVVARNLGRVGGRRRVITDSRVESARKLLAAGRLPNDVAADLGISVPTLDRWVPASASADV